MRNFSFLRDEETFNVDLKGKSYPVVKVGKGIPCILICLGTPSFRTLSKKFAEIFTVYSSDLYWVKNRALDNPTLMTMDTIVDDIKAVGDALGLEKYVIFAHSAYGIIALEFAKNILMWLQPL